MSESQATPNLTGPEQKMFGMLESMGIEFTVHPRVLVRMFGKRRRLTPDFFVPAENLLIEVNGCFVHGCPDCGHGDELKLWKDRVRLDALTRAGYNVDVVWEHELQVA
jgi:G:T-mismatch repair DNA endonuclease (very short patch repair protein)